MERLIIDRGLWRTGADSKNKTGFGTTFLLNKEGFMCCLGFCVQQLGIKEDDLKGKALPSSLNNPKIGSLLLNERGFDNEFTKIAVSINDDESITSQEREAKLILHFKEEGIDIIFTGQYLTI